MEEVFFLGGLKSYLVLESLSKILPFKKRLGFMKMKWFCMFVVLTCLSGLNCYAEWRPYSEIVEDLASDDPIIHEAANAEFGLVDGRYGVLIAAENDNSEYVSIEKIVDHYKVSCAFSYFPGRDNHHWIVFLDENHKFLTEFQFPDCREYQIVKLGPVFKAIKYFLVEERFGPMIN